VSFVRWPATAATRRRARCLFLCRTLFSLCVRRLLALPVKAASITDSDTLFWQAAIAHSDHYPLLLLTLLSHCSVQADTHGKGKLLGDLLNQEGFALFRSPTHPQMRFS